MLKTKTILALALALIGTAISIPSFACNNDKAKSCSCQKKCHCSTGKTCSCKAQPKAN